MNNQYRIGELSEKAGVTKRTIHYYMGRGMLPSPEGSGLGTTYSDEHLYRIMLIKKLQDSYLPLDEIKKRLNMMSLAEVKENLENQTLSEVKIEVRSNKLEKIGVTYKRINVGHGVEIHYPDNEKASKLVHELNSYIEKLMKEG